MLSKVGVLAPGDFVFVHIGSPRSKFRFKSGIKCTYFFPIDVDISEGFSV